MQSVMSVKLDKTWKEANRRFGWVPEIEALPVEYNMLLIADMAGKHVHFTIKNRKRGFLISPNVALETVKLHKSFFTRRYDGKVIAVIPSSACEVI